jgi:hypothetical protein
VKKKLLFLSLFLSCSSALAAHEVTLDLGGVAETSVNPGPGSNFQLGYRYDFTPQLSFYGGYSTGGVFPVGEFVNHIVTGGVLEDKFLPSAYQSVPLSVQFNLPRDNNLFFARLGGSVYQVEDDVKVIDSQGNVIASRSGKKSGIGFYGAAGWRYYFGEKRNWNAGLVYQYFDMRPMKVHSVSLSLGYRF